ncbi:hypothetical protein [Gracilibacillus timonensis]|nr:hypothetical protein [Gracilibacillus timonensis]
MVCEKEILPWIAYTYRDDEAFQAYIIQFRKNTLSEFVYQVIKGENQPNP